MSSEPATSEHSSTELVFDVLAEIAAGTTARIELCRVKSPEVHAGKLVAVKRLHKHIADDHEFADMFFDEVWMTASLHHPNVVDVVGWGNDDEGTYFAVELVQGVSLARLMKTVFETGELFSERMVVYLGSKICAGLSAAHELRGQGGELLQLIHRDLTPGNVLIGFNGQIKIADFGLAKAKQRVTKTLTGLLKGNPQYMAPEMTRGFETDKRADLFSVGVVLFELFAGSQPWSAVNELDIMRVIATEPPRNLLKLRPKIDPKLAGIVDALLEKDPDRRFQRAEEVRELLLQWLDAHGYNEGNEDALGRFVRRNAMRQMRWFERAVAGQLTEQSKPMASVAPPSRGTGIDRPKVPPPPRLRRNRRIGEEKEITDTDQSEIPTKDESPLLSGSPVDWGEEIPTVVQNKKAGVTGFSSNALASIREGNARVRAAAAPANGAEAPPIADEDSDGRTTSVKKKDPVYASVTAPTRVGPRAPEPFADPPSEEHPTHRVQKVPANAGAEGLGAIGMQLPGSDALRRPPPSASSSGKGRAAPPGLDPEAASYRGSTGDLLIDEADRLAVEALRLRDEADQAAEEARHRTLLATLAHDAAALAAEAVRARVQGSVEKAKLLLQDALKLEEALLDHAANPGNALASDLPRPQALSFGPPPPSGEATGVSRLYSAPDLRAPVDSSLPQAPKLPSFPRTTQKTSEAPIGRSPGAVSLPAITVPRISPAKSEVAAKAARERRAEPTQPSQRLIDEAARQSLGLEHGGSRSSSKADASKAGGGSSRSAGVVGRSRRTNRSFFDQTLFGMKVSTAILVTSGLVCLAAVFLILARC